ncbi:hypothetical protein Ddye_028226 [Dipteronia dyeriana]|uniref:Receptor-like serine/threonine-protein kinase n=1 Tax=Dipteronia dyeriana TaxID=168575 RepID=A0AAD9TR92_9ROSI|nr:hypothetical protein Ddye_028226 [Dipteronia dyeriana]
MGLNSVWDDWVFDFVPLLSTFAEMLILYTTIIIIYFFLLIITTLSLDTITVGQSIKDGETVVSAGNVFELGFFSPGKSSGRYLGIWYKNDGEKSVAWVANRNTSISDSSGFLSINAKGNLVLRMNSTYHSVWSSNTSTRLQNPVAVLLESGNLVVKDGNDNNPGNFFWQSFDYPCHTLLPGMKIGQNLVSGKEWFLSSWKSIDDPAPGEFTVLVDPHGFPQSFVKKGPEILYRAGSWNGLRWTGTPQHEINPVYTYEFLSNEKEVFYKFEIRNRSVPSRLAVSPSGDVQRFTWIDRTHTWAKYSTLMIDLCDKYALCGSNASCNINKSPAVCECLEGFAPKSPGEWEVFDWTEGCVRKPPLPCNHSDGFLKYESVKLPDTSNSWVDKNISLVECEKLCLNNCSCTAYANSDVRGGGTGCLLWFNGLLDTRKLTEKGQALYLRVAASQLDNIDRTRKHIARRRQLSGKKRVIIIVTCVISAIGLLVLGWIIFTWKRKVRNQGKTGNSQDINDNSEENKNDDMELLMYDLNSIANATNNFADKNKLGEGGFGPVYKGTLMEGKEIAIKRLSKYSGQGIEEFKNEVILIAKLQHRNLVKLLGCCIQRDERMLIYEYMPNKSLDYFIFDKTRRELLDWSKRIQIIGGIARGLLYLHQDSRLRIIHRDLKASNVLLDNEMNPKISDFGLAKTFRGDQTKGETKRIVGTYGYMSPEYAVDGIFSVKSDIFSFGVLLLEMVSGRRNRGFYHADHNHNLLGHAWRLWNEERTVELIDQQLDYSSSSSEILRCIHVGLLCVQQRPEDRPNMSTVALMLGGEGSLPRPNQPGFFTERNLTEPESSSLNNEITISLLEPR